MSNQPLKKMNGRLAVPALGKLAVAFLRVFLATFSVIPVFSESEEVGGWLCQISLGYK